MHAKKPTEADKQQTARRARLLQRGASGHVLLDDLAKSAMAFAGFAAAE
jgi:hypothetical protein